MCKRSVMRSVAQQLAGSVHFMRFEKGLVEARKGSSSASRRSAPLERGGTILSFEQTGILIAW